VHGTYGYSARGVILCVLGYIFIRGALSRNPFVVGDTDTAFDFIGGGAIGDTAFAVVALGTVAYGVLMHASAWWQDGADSPAVTTRTRRWPSGR
jgi:hypothetical protein